MITSLGASALCAVLLLGCDAEPVDFADHAESASPRTSAVLCSDEEHIAVRSDGVCTDIGAWEGSTLFAGGTPYLDGDGEPLPEVLGGYCRYTWNGSGDPDEQAISDLYGAAQLDQIGASCLAVSGQADAMTNALGATLQEIFRVHVGRPSAADIGLPGSGTATPEVTVMVVDTHPDTGLSPTSKHGRSMGELIGDIGCPDAATDCRVAVEYVTGLPRVSGRTADYLHGGIVGTHEDLALGIYEAVRRWEDANDERGESNRLVINLSVAWEGDIFGGGGGLTPPTPVGAVYDALRVASCKGALIVAAVGNESDFCGMTGPMLPGGWETLDAPTATECSTLGVTNIDVPAPLVGQPDYRPLVHAVGGMGLGLQAMPQSRDSANPRLLATAAHAVNGTPLHAGLTGTSVAAAATSGAAALVWSHRPDLGVSEVMGTIYDTAHSLSVGNADFALGGTAPSEVRQVDACAALDQACTDSNNTWICGISTPPMTCLSSVSPTAADLRADLSALNLGPPLVAPSCSTTQSCVDACGALVDVRVPPGETANCAVFDVDPVDHLINPAPDDISCPTCGFTENTATLSLSIDDAYAGDPIQGVIVTLDDGLGDERRLNLGILTLSPSSITEIVLQTDDLPTGPVRSGEIIIDYTAHDTTTDALIIL